MGNKSSKVPDINSDAIVSWYASEAARNANARGDTHNSDSATEREVNQDKEVDTDDTGDTEDTDTPRTENPGNNEPPSASEHSQHMSRSGIIPTIALPSNSTVAAAVQLTAAAHAATAQSKDAIRAIATKTQDGLDVAIAVLKKMGFDVLAKTAFEWIKAHLWETAAIVVPLILLCCTPVILGAFGSTAGGIAAGTRVHLHFSLGDR
jgi:hypothetical protein